MLQHKIIGLDVGSKTVGIAISDLMGWTAQGLDTPYQRRTKRIRHRRISRYY